MTPRDRARRVIPARYEGSAWADARDRAEAEIRETWRVALEAAAQAVQDETLAERIRKLKIEAAGS